MVFIRLITIIFSTLFSHIPTNFLKLYKSTWHQGIRLHVMHLISGQKKISFSLAALSATTSHLTGGLKFSVHAYQCYFFTIHRPQRPESISAHTGGGYGEIFGAISQSVDSTCIGRLVGIAQYFILLRARKGGPVFNPPFFSNARCDDEPFLAARRLLC